MERELKELLGTEDPVDHAVFACIASHGIQNVTMDIVARAVGRSRTSFYRQFTSWQELVARTHRRTVGLIDGWFPPPRGDRRLELERLWSSLMAFLSSAWGHAFLAMRPHLASEYGISEVEFLEMRRMPTFVRWVDSSPLVARTVWALVLTAGCPSLRARERHVMRELVWSRFICSGVDVDPDEVDLSRAHPLGGFLSLQ